MTKRFSRATLAVVGVGLLIPLVLLGLYMLSIGGAGISTIYFLLAAAVPYGLSLVEDIEPAGPDCTSAIHL